MSKILYNDKPEIGLSELSNIYLALISLADIIYINKDIKISSHLDKKNHKHIDDNIEYLKDEGLLKIWAWPHMTPSLNSPDLVIFPEQDYLFWSKLINETFFLYLYFFKSINSSTQTTISFPFLSIIVLLLLTFLVILSFMIESLVNFTSYS